MANGLLAALSPKEVARLKRLGLVGESRMGLALSLLGQQRLGVALRSPPANQRHVG